MTRWSGQRHNGDCETRVRHNDGKASIYLVVDQGTLTVHHLGKTVSLGRYATHEFAAKAAAVYFAKHQARKKPSALPSASSLGHALQKMSGAPTANFSREQIPPNCIGAASINSAYASASNLGVAMARWIKCAHQNC